MNRLIPTLVLAGAVSACGTFHGSTSQLLSGRWREVTGVTLSPGGAEVWADGKRYGVTPMAIDLDKLRDREVTFKRPGYRETSVQLAQSLNSRYVIFDVVDGLVPVVIDAGRQSWYLLDKYAVRATLQPTDGRDHGVKLRGTLTDDQVSRLVAGEPAATVIEISKAGR